MGVILVLSAASSMLSLSSMQCFWSIVNILQLAMLIPLTQAFIPESVVDYLVGMAFANFNFGFVPVAELSVIKNLDFEVHSGYISDIGVESSSTFVNYLMTLILIGLIFIIHVLVGLTNKCIPIDKKNKWYSKCLKKVFEHMTFGAYIRLLLESFQLMLLSSLVEIKSFIRDDTRQDDGESNSETKIILSFGFSVLLLLVCASLIILMVEEWIRSRKAEAFKTQTYFREFFVSVEDSWSSRSFCFLSFFRKSFLVGIVVFCTVAKTPNILIFSGGQLVYYATLVYLRPLITIKENLVELINEGSFTILALGILYLNDQEAWTSFLEKSYYWVLIINSILISLILLVDLIRDLIKRLRNRRRENASVGVKKTSETIRITFKHETTKRASDKPAENVINMSRISQNSNAKMKRSSQNLAEESKTAGLSKIQRGRYFDEAEFISKKY